MAKSINRLSPLQVKRLAEPGLYPDGGNLYLSVSRTGAKSWRIIYVKGGKRVELGIGALDTVSLAEARTKAAEARKLLHDGIDLKAHWSKQRASSNGNFGTVALAYIEAHEPSWKNAKHRQQWRNSLKTYAAPI